MDKKQLEEQVIILKLKGYDTRINIDIEENKIFKLREQFGNIVIKIDKLATKLLKIEEKEMKKKNGNGNNRK